MGLCQSPEACWGENKVFMIRAEQLIDFESNSQLAKDAV